MTLLQIVLSCTVVFVIAYRVYGAWLTKWMALDDRVTTPAVQFKDGADYEPIEPKFLISQHLSAIAAAGPIVGPILAGIYFGWLPALLWIVVGSVLVGGVYDFSSLVASIRHRARTITEVVRLHMTRRAHLLFLSFVWIALIYIVVAFTDITAQAFVGQQSLENGQKVTGGGIATSSLLYLALPVIMGVLLRYTKISLSLATCIFVPLVGVAIWFGQTMPFDVGALLGVDDHIAVKYWDVALLVYCFFASIAPMWLLLQPRGHLGGYFLFVTLAFVAIGLAFGGHKVEYPAFIGWHSKDGMPLIPILFITIACGACSGFHSIIISGTTSKQLKKQTDARVIGYGTMLLEGLVAVTALCCVMMLNPVKDAALLKSPPNQIYAMGLGRFTEVMGLPAAFVVSFGLMAFTTFVYDTLDVCTRLGRYILQELTGWHDTKGKLIATALTAGIPLLFVTQTAHDAKGKVIPVWKVFWSLFGSTNQLLAALTLLVLVVYFGRTMTGWRRRAVPLVLGVPAAFMFFMSVWAMLISIRASFFPVAGPARWHDPAAWVACVLVALAAVLLVEAVMALCRKPSLPEGHAAPPPDLDLWETAK